jgi:hypothetical protein
MRFLMTRFSAPSVVQDKICQIQVGALSALLPLKQFRLLTKMKLVANKNTKRWMLILLIGLLSR